MAEVAQRSYEETELRWTYLSFMNLATVIAAIAIVLDSQILVIGAMVLGPEFGAIAALGVALVRRRFALLALAAHPHSGFHGGHRHHSRPCTAWPGFGMDHPWRCDRATARHRLHLRPGQVVLRRRRHRGDG